MNNYFNDFKPKENIVEGETVQLDVPTLVRSKESGDKIYFVKNNTKHWVTSPEVLKALNFDFGQEKEIDRNLMAQLQSGEPIRMENVNEYILPVEEEKPQKEALEEPTEGIEIPAQEEEVDNSRMDGYFTVIVPCVLTHTTVNNLPNYIEALRKYFSGEIISVVKNTIEYKNYSPKFGNKVIECEDLQEGIERAERVARGGVMLSNEIT